MSILKSVLLVRLLVPRLYSVELILQPIEAQFNHLGEQHIRKNVLHNFDFQTTMETKRIPIIYKTQNCPHIGDVLN